MADKTTTLKTKTNDNVYPNIIGDNMDNAIVNSAHIKHNLTADHKINFRLDDNVSNLIFNSLQKPAGLTKTKLVGVGTNGQENIEIGDNLTLENGKLAAIGGASVSPTLWLVDVETMQPRTSITEEEYNNLKNGLYNSVNYFTEEPYEAYLQSKILSAYDDSDKSLHCAFSSIKITATSETDISLTNIIYDLIIGQKDTSGNYPITIEKEIEIPFGSSGGGASSLNTIPCYVIDNFNDGDHDQQGFVMPTEDVVLFTDGNSTSLIGYKAVRDNITYYFCYEWKPQIEGKLKTYENFVYKISEINIGYKIETTNISQAFNQNLMFLPGYSSSDNGKVLSVVDDKAQWASASGSGSIPPLPADASTSTYVLKAVNGTVQWVKES